MPLYTVGVAMATVLAMCLLTLWAGVSISKKNAQQLIDRYEADKVATARANQGLYCTLFGAQADAFAEATTPAGRASYEAWLAVYRLAQCQPERTR